MSAIQITLPKKPLLIAGLMSGTSADGIDVALLKVEQTGTPLSFQCVHFSSVPYASSLRTLILEQAEKNTSDVWSLSQLNFRLAHAFKEVLDKALQESGYGWEELDLIGSHGHTVHHIPVAAPVAGMQLCSTLQIGDPAVLATLTGVPVVGDFRVADMAAGGQGAPLVPFLEFFTLMDPMETRGVLNLGGIANLSVLPRGGRAQDVIAFDTGPANMVIDALCLQYFDIPFDKGGAIAKAGTVINPLLEEMLQDAFFQKPPPKSTGREAFGKEFLLRFIESAHGYQEGVRPEDLVATATALTARSIGLAHQRFVAPHYTLTRLILSGGGLHNETLIGMLQEHMGRIPVEPASDYGLDPDAKEAICFALMAYETLQGHPTNLPSVTGADKPVMLGKICLPPP